MRLRLVLLLAFIVIPLVEIALFIVVGQRIGVGPTLAIVLLTAVAGSWLVARQGGETWVRFRQEIGAGVFPGRTLAHGAMILFGGALLLTPGFLTDAIGFSLLIPPVREAIRRAMIRRTRGRWTAAP